MSAYVRFHRETGREPTPAIRLFTLASRATRLLRVPSMLPSTAFGLRVRVLAGFGSRPLKDNRKTGPDRNRQGSPKLRLSAIPSPCSARRRFYKVRSVPANPFDNTEKYAPVMAVSLVRNGDNGGETGIRTLGRLAPTTVFETAPFDHSGTSPRER